MATKGTGEDWAIGPIGESTCGVGMALANEFRDATESNCRTLRGSVIRRVVRWAARIVVRARGATKTKIRDVSYRVDPYHIGFWRAVARGQWEPELLESLDRNLKSGSTYLDVGAWIGPTVLFAARRCGKVYCFEPDPDAFQFLAWNLRLNGLRNVVPFCTALTSTSGIRSIASPDGLLGTSKSSLLLDSVPGDRVEVPCTSWSDWLRLVAPAKIDVIKIDIEGGEFELLPAMAAFLQTARPTLLLSLHAGFLPPETREAKLDDLLAAVRHYTVCHDEAGRQVSLSEVRSTALDRLCTVVFSGAPS